MLQLPCPEDRTALAQADVEDLERTGKLHRINFPGTGKIATIRPELLPACFLRPAGERDIVDRWLLSHLAEAIDLSTNAFEEHDYMQAHQAASRMFWSVFCDRYLEMVKDRLAARADALVRGPAEHASGVDGITVAIAV